MVDFVADRESPASDMSRGESVYQLAPHLHLCSSACSERPPHLCFAPYFEHGGAARVMALQFFLPLLLLTKIATTAASAAIIAKAKRVGLIAVEPPVSQFNPATSLFAKSVKKPT